MQVLTVPGWGLGVYDARYYGRRWCVQIGPLLIFVWQQREQ